MLAALGLGTSCAVAEEDFYEVPMGKQPDHLEPVPGDRSKSRLCTVPAFKDGSGGSLWARYEVEPSFAPPYCVSLWEADDGTGCWLVVTSTLKMGVPRTAEAEVAALENGKTAPVLEDRRAISKSLAVAIQRAWVRGLMKTRYPEHLSGGLDGASFYFTAAVRPIGLMAGQTWSPPNGTLPAKMVELGQALCELATHPDQKEEPLMEKLKAFQKEPVKKK